MKSGNGTERDPITCAECGDELPFAFEDQRDSITCMRCIRGEGEGEDDDPDLPTIKGRGGDIDLRPLETDTNRGEDA